MSNSGLFEAHRKEDCTGMIQRLTYSITGLGELIRNAVEHIGVKLETRRYRDADERGPDPDAPPVTADDLERLIKRIAREQEPGLRMGDYHESGGRDRWIIPGLVTLAVSGIIGNVVQSMTVAALRQEVSDMRIELNDLKKLVEPRYRGAP